MSVDRKALAGALAVLLLVGACGGSATQAPGASQAPAASQSPIESQAPAASQEATASQQATASEAPAASQAAGAAGDLEATLPSEVNGVQFTKTSFNGGIIPGGIPIGTGDEDLGKFLADNGKSLSDVRIAMATAVGSTSAGNLVMAIQVQGVPSDKLLAWVTTGSGDMPQATVGGKQVYGAAVGGFGAYFYVKGDVAYYVLSMGGDASMAEGIVKQLP